MFFGDFADVGMGIGVIPDLVPFIHNPFDETRVFFGLAADQEEDGLDIGVL